MASEQGFEPVVLWAVSAVLGTHHTRGWDEHSDMGKVVLLHEASVL